MGDRLSGEKGQYGCGVGMHCRRYRLKIGLSISARLKFPIAAK